MVDEYGQPVDYGEEQEMGMHGGYGQENDDDGMDDESLNFDDNPEYAHLPKLDRMRKIRREIVKTINDLREAHNSPSIYVDTFANKAANEYASYLLQNPEEEE